MKILKIIMLIFFIAGISQIQAQWLSKSSKNISPYGKKTKMMSGDSLAQMVYVVDTVNTRISGINLQADSLTIYTPSSITNGIKTVSTTASALVATSKAARYVYIENNSGQAIKLGGSSVTWSNGRTLNSGMFIRYEINNANKLYVITNSGNADIIYEIRN